MRPIRALVPFLWAVFVASGCGGANTAGSGDGVAVSAAGAGITAAAAGALWVAGGGCRLQGCPYGTYCDEKNGLCDVRRCSEGCPDGTVCNEGLDRCQAPSPPAPPNDFLPTDDKRLLPGTH